MIYVEKLIIKNFKCFRNIEIKFNKNVNIIVGNNEEGKSTILEALHLALSGMINGRPLRNEISEYFFNYEIKTEYIESIRTEHKLLPPEILIEVLLNSADTDNAQEDSLLAQLSGDGNYEGNKDQCGISFKICFNEEYQDEYLNLIQESLTTIPVEYYKIEWTTFARGTITSRSIPIKSVIIDSSSSRFQNGSDVYISKIIKDGLDEKEIVALSQAYRKLKEAFKDDSAMSKINAKITDEAKISDKNVSVSVDMSVKNSWETILMTYIENIPFQQIGKGEQCIIKTNLALSHKMALASNLILIEEPENHLSHSNLNILTNNINEKCSEKQLIITTHSNYIANKLRLDNIIFLSNKIVTYFSNIDKEDADYFYKLPGYDTLRLILSQSAILVEGPSDELIVQKAFFYKYNVLPIEKGVDVISVKGLSFKRFLSIAKMTTKKVAVITDNDGDYNKNILEKYAPFNECPNIKICADNRNEIKTLEPQFVDANKEDLKKLRTLLNIEETRYPNSESISKYMQQNKTDWALFVFDAGEHYNIPQYINDAIDFVYGK